MIILRTDLSIAGRPDIWQSEVRVKNLTPTRRDKLINLINLSGFVLRTDDTDMRTGEIRNINEVLMLEV